MSEPLPDPRIDVRSGEYDSSDEEEDDIFATIKPKDSEERTENTISSQTKTSNKGSKKSRKRTHCKKDFVCKKCQPIRCFKTAKVLDHHKDIVHNSKRSVCLWCAKHFYSENQLLVHQKLYFHDKPLH